MDPVAVLARFVQYLGAAVVFGWPVVGRLVGASQPTVNATWIGAVALASGALASLFGQTAVMMGDGSAALDPGVLWQVLSGTAFGLGLAVRLVLTTALLIAIGLKARPSLQLALGAAATASMALTGHAAGGEGAAGLVHQAADALHMLAAAVWVGALIAFSRAAFGLAATRRTMETQAALARFAGVGSAVVAVLVLTGLINVAILVTPTGAFHLTKSDYGWWLLIKLALFVLMLCLAAANRFVLTPRLAMALSNGPASEAALKGLRASLAIETLLGVAVLGAVAVLGRLPPASESLLAP